MVGEFAHQSRRLFTKKCSKVTICKTSIIILLHSERGQKKGRVKCERYGTKLCLCLLSIQTWLHHQRFCSRIRSCWFNPTIILNTLWCFNSIIGVSFVKHCVPIIHLHVWDTLQSVYASLVSEEQTHFCFRDAASETNNFLVAAQSHYC